MEYTVVINPSGRRFTAYANETILESGLRAGHNLKYQCDNGACGECKARLLSGDVRSICNSDFSFTTLEKEQGYFLPCCCTPVGDIEIRADEIHHVTDIPQQEISARVKKIERLSNDIIILRLRTPRTQTLCFLAGQSATLRLADQHDRILQIASCPCNGMLLEFHIRRCQGDPFSDYLFERLAVNDEIVVQGPCGQFTLDEDTRRPLIFIAYDVGFAGVKSLIEHAIALELEQDMRLYRIACHAEQDYMHNICRSWADALDNLHYHTFEHCVPVDCNDAGKAATCDQFLSMLSQNSDASISDSDVYLSGVDDMILNLEKRLIAMGLPADRLKAQRVG